MAMEDSKTSESKGVYEVEMSETKQRLSTGPATPWSFGGRVGMEHDSFAHKLTKQKRWTIGEAGLDQ